MYSANSVCNGFGLDLESAFSILWNWNVTKCQPPWSETEMRHKIEDAIQIGDKFGRLRGWMLDESPNLPDDAIEYRAWVDRSVNTFEPFDCEIDDPLAGIGFDVAPVDSPAASPDQQSNKIFEIELGTDEFRVNQIAALAISQDEGSFSAGRPTCSSSLQSGQDI